MNLACCRGASGPSGRVRHGGPGQHRDVRAATLIERVQATHGMGPAPEGTGSNIVSPGSKVGWPPT